MTEINSSLTLFWPQLPDLSFTRNSCSSSNRSLSFLLLLLVLSLWPLSYCRHTGGAQSTLGWPSAFSHYAVWFGRIFVQMQMKPITEKVQVSQDVLMSQHSSKSPFSNNTRAANTFYINCRSCSWLIVWSLNHPKNVRLQSKIQNESIYYNETKSINCLIISAVKILICAGGMRLVNIFIID